MLKKAYYLLVFSVCICRVASAQTSQFSVWGAWFHSHQLSEHWGYAFDGQFRSADKVDYLRNILLRPSVSYKFNNKHMVNLGYAYVTTNGRTATGAKTFRPESRIFEQYTISHKVSPAISMQHRFRLEQRFLGETAKGANNDFFAQRFRYFIRSIIPLQKTDNFSKGTYVALQNELFLNVQNKDKVNTHFFDQNRAYAAFGFRFSKKFDMEVGYMNQYTKAVSSGTSNNVAQLALYTRL